MQGGVKNYLGNQKMVNAPLNWRSGPQHPSTELAYITQAEKDLLVNKDLHASLKGGVNRGPSGIMSLNGWGDTGEGFADKSFAGQEQRSRSIDVKGPPNVHGGTTRTKQIAKKYTPKDHFEQSWSGPERFFGLTGGYRDLKTPSVTGGDRPYKSRLGGLGRGLLSLFGGVPGKVISALSNFKENKNLAEWWRNRNTPVEEESEETTSDYQLTPDGYRYVGGSMDDTMKEFRQKYPLDLRNTNVISDYPNYLTPNLGGDYRFRDSRFTKPVDNSQYYSDNLWLGAKDGGRIGYAFAGPVGVEQQTDFIEGPQGANEFQETVVEGQEQPSREQLEALAMHIFQLPLDDLDEQQLLVVYQTAMQG